jgi:hypothetical protein
MGLAARGLFETFALELGGGELTNQVTLGIAVNPENL